MTEGKEPLKLQLDEGTDPLKLQRDEGTDPLKLQPDEGKDPLKLQPDEGSENFDILSRELGLLNEQGRLQAARCKTPALQTSTPGSHSKDSCAIDGWNENGAGQNDSVLDESDSTSELHIIEDDGTPLRNSQKRRHSLSESSATPKKKVLLEDEDVESDADIVSLLSQELDSAIHDCLGKRFGANGNFKIGKRQVKSIIKDVILNDGVQAMLRNTLNEQKRQEQMSSGSISEIIDEPAIYEPKLTRAKTKELLEKKALPWGITHCVTPSTAASQVLVEKEFSEDSSDEEYDPIKDNRGDVGSDEEDTYSHLSSPALSTPRSRTKTADEDITSSTSDAIFKVPGPVGHVRRSLTFEDADLENIGQRTRSKLPLNDTSLEALESQFQPPDVTLDMYGTSCDNEDYINFLTRMYLSGMTNCADTGDDDDADPEYNAMEEEEPSDDEKEELRADRAVKVSKKEVEDLYVEISNWDMDMPSSDGEDCNDLLNAFNDDLRDDITDIGQKDIVEESSVPDGTSNKESVYEITSEQRDQLDQQLRIHVQQLTQTYLLGYNRPTYHKIAENSYSLLKDLERMGRGKFGSAFSACNLPHALDVVSRWQKICKKQNLWNEDGKILRSNDTALHNSMCRDHKVDCRLMVIPEKLIPLVMSSEAFVYPHLLPVIPFVKGKVCKFLKSEDQLIAMGLEQFLPHAKELLDTEEVNLLDVANLISEYMMPARNGNNIHKRIKVLMNKYVPENPINYYYVHNKAPPVSEKLLPFDPCKVMAPENQSEEQLHGVWLMYFSKHSKDAKDSNTLLLDSSKNYALRPIAPASDKPDLAAPTLTKSKKRQPKFVKDRRVAGNRHAPVPIMTVLPPLSSGVGATYVITIPPSQTPVPQVIYLPHSHGSSTSNIQQQATEESDSTVEYSNNAVLSIEKVVGRPAVVHMPTPITCDVSAKALLENRNSQNLSSPVLSSDVVDSSTKDMPSPVASDLATPKKVSQSGTLSVLPDSSADIQSTSIPGALDMPVLSTPLKKDCTNNGSVCSTRSATPLQQVAGVTSINEVENRQETSSDEVIGKYTEECNVKSPLKRAAHILHEKYNMQLNSEPAPKSSLAALESSCSSSVSNTNITTEPGPDSVQNEIGCDKKTTSGAAVFGLSLQRLGRHLIVKTCSENSVCKIENICNTITDEGDSMTELNNAYMNAYFERAEKTLDSETYAEFCRYLFDFDNGCVSVPELYSKLASLCTGHSDLLQELVGYMSPSEALACGKYDEHLMYTRMRSFIQNLEMSFQDDPHHLEKVLTLLGQLQLNPTVGRTALKRQMIPLLCGKKRLIDACNELL